MQQWIVSDIEEDTDVAEPAGLVVSEEVYCLSEAQIISIILYIKIIKFL